jgi:hypothetical protein
MTQTDKYKIPANEVQLTKYNLLRYLIELREYQQGL